MITRIFSAVLLLLLASFANIAAAQPAERVPEFTQSDENGDGQPDLTRLTCQCVTENDLIMVYDGAGDMRSAMTWQEAVDQENDVWIIDIGGDGKAELILRFDVTPGNVYRADLYDDVNRNGEVAYRVRDGRVTITESRYWTMRVQAENGWIMPDGQPNLNLDVWMDGPIGDGWFEFLDDHLSAQYLFTDGVVDVEFKIADLEKDGVANYYLATLINKLPRRFEIGESELWYNAEKHVSTAPEEAVFWPFLDFNAFVRGTDPNVFDFYPTVVMRWDEARLVGFRPLGYPVEEGYWLNSVEPIYVGRTNGVDFEAPHAFYDLAQNNDGFPELNIRILEVGEPTDPEEIRYSWSLSPTVGTLRWDYKIGLLARKEIETTVDYVKFTINQVPFDDIPAWVVRNPWDLSTFVAREGAGYPSTEGIYEWTPFNGADPISPENPSIAASEAAFGYLNGHLLVPPREFLTAINSGLRGEYNYSRALRPRLYFSPITRRLHLVHAEWGIANLDDTQFVITRNLNNDPYLDAWYHISEGEIQSTLFQAGGYLIYADGEGVLMQRFDDAPALFETTPPTNHRQWAEMDARLAEERRDFAYADLKAMFDQIDNPVGHLEGATLTDFRLIEDGFRFVLDVTSEFRAEQFPTAAFDALTPGRYVITWVQSGVTVDPLMPAHLEIDLNAATLPETPLIELAPLETTIPIRNTGSEDVKRALVSVLQYQGGAYRVIHQEQVDILGESTTGVTFVWAPQRDQAHPLRVELALSEASAVDLLYPVAPFEEGEEQPAPLEAPEPFLSAELVVEIQDNTASSWRQYLTLGGELPAQGLLVLLALGALSLAAMLIFWLIMRTAE